MKEMLRTHMLAPDVLLYKRFLVMATRKLFKGRTMKMNKGSDEMDS